MVPPPNRQSGGSRRLAPLPNAGVAKGEGQSAVALRATPTAKKVLPPLPASGRSVASASSGSSHPTFRTMPSSQSLPPLAVPIGSSGRRLPPLASPSPTTTGRSKPLQPVAASSPKPAVPLRPSAAIASQKPAANLRPSSAVAPPISRLPLTPPSTSPSSNKPAPTTVGPSDRPANVSATNLAAGAVVQRRSFGRGGSLRISEL